MLDRFPVVHVDLRCFLHAVIGHLKIGHIHEEGALLQPGSLDDGLVRQRHAVDDIAFAHCCRQIIGNGKLHIRIFGAHFFDIARRILRSDIIDIAFFQRRTDDLCRFELGPPLCPGSADRDDLCILDRKELHRHTAGSAGPLGTDFSPVSHAHGQFRIRVIQDQGDTGTGEPLLIVLGAAADPLDARHIVIAANETGHGIDPPIDVFVLRRLAPAHDELARDIDIAQFRQLIGILHVLDDIRHIVGAQFFQGFVVQEQDIDFFHSCISFTCHS